jgi:hypothetical protein
MVVGHHHASDHAYLCLLGQRPRFEVNRTRLSHRLCRVDSRGFTRRPRSEAATISSTLVTVALHRRGACTFRELRTWSADRTLLLSADTESNEALVDDRSCSHPEWHRPAVPAKTSAMLCRSSTERGGGRGLPVFRYAARLGLVCVGAG